MRQAGVEAIKSSEKIICNIDAGHSGQGIVKISLVQCGHHAIVGKLVLKVTEKEIGH